MDEERKITEESSLLKQAFLAIQEMQAKLDAAERSSREPIAVIGMGCRLPGGVVDGETFWELLREGRDAVSTVPSARWNADDYYDPDPDRPGKMVTRQGGFLDQVDEFDARFFEIAPREAASMDPQQRLALEVAWEALENAGYAPAGLRGSKTGVFLGIASRDYSQLGLQLGDPERMDGHYALGVSHSIASGRISYLQGLEGPSISLDTACSSSLVAVHLACQSLRTGDCVLALAGGVNLMLAPETTALLSRLRMLSPGGCCKTFDESADGFVRGEGCGFVALKTLSNAQADGDRILAVIRGTAVNQDGASSSLTAPNGPSQVSLMRQALANAGVLPGQVSYIEAHGTGTPLGDPIELQALGAVYGAGRPPGKPLAVGSLKTNIGHLETSAGIAGLIKTVLACEHHQIPPHLHLKQLTPHVRWDELRLTVPQKLIDWAAGSGTGQDTRIAAVSSFGYSGTNAHVVIEEAPSPDIARRETGWPVQILTASAKTKTALQDVVRQYRGYLEQHATACISDTRIPDTDLRDFCFTANTGRSHFLHRACFVAPDVETMKQQLATFEAPVRSSSGEEGRVGFLFTGQGSQYGGMGRELYASSPVFREGIERCAAAWKQETGESLTEVLYPGEGEGSRMEQARYAQPALFAFEYALAELWRSWGVEPSVLLGHSLGEYVAAVVAGVFSVEDGLRLVCARARLMDTLTRPGAMQSISASAERVGAEIAGLEKEVAVAVINGPESVVLSGAAETVARIAKKLEAAGVRTRALAVTHAFHSPLLEPILEEFEACAGQVKYHAPRIRILSNLTGETARADRIATPRYWREHMRETVLFHAGLQAALATGCKTFLEIGPQPHLLTLGKSANTGANLSWLPSARRGRNAWLDILNAVQSLYELGAEIDWRALHGKSGRPIALPTYPFERQRYWFPQKTAEATQLPVRSSQGHPLLGLRLDSPLAEIQFQSRIGPDQPAYLSDHVVAGRRVVAGAAYLEMALSAFREANGEPASVRAVVFLQPCIFDEPQILQCVLQVNENGRTFAIYSRPETSEEKAWILHATGEIGAESSRDIEASQHVDLDGIRKRCTDELDASAFYRAFEANNVHFGPNFRPVTRVFRGDNEALVELEIPSDVKADGDRYQIHPVVLDGCLQSVVALLSNTDEVHLPAALESLHLVGDPRNLVAAHAQIHGRDSIGSGEPLAARLLADVRGFDRFGDVVLYATGLMMRPLKQEYRGQPEVDSISKSFYEVEWMPIEADLKHGLDIPGTCVLSGVGEIVSNLSAALLKSGIPCATIPPEEVRAAKEERHYDRLLQTIREQEFSPISDFIYIAPFTLEDVFRLSSDRLMEIEADVLGECSAITQALLQMNLDSTPRLWIVTRGAQGPASSNVSHSTLWGFGRSVAAEHPEMRVVRIDLDPAREANADELLQCIRAAGVEDELVLRGRETYVPRLRTVAPDASEAKHVSVAEETNLRLELVQAGTLEGIESVPASRPDLEPGEVEIRVAAAGLNFRDVLNVLGMYKGKSGPLGGECAGTVVRVGAGVESIRPGDEVIALGQGCFARFMTARATMVWPKPANLSFEAAVTIPVAFLTAWYGLKSIAAIQPGERVLIHAGAGGVGLAAIQIAQNAGATVFATAGSPEKRAYLASIGVRHVMDSRSLDFVGGIREITNGQGVEIVLNSLAGPFIDAGMEILASCGRFVELGVADIRSAESVASLRPDITYQPFNLAPALEAGDRFVGEILKAVFEKFQTGDFNPLPRKTFSLENARDAFRYMAQARHIGRVVICPAEMAGRVGIRSDGAYLVTGGLSGVGLTVAEWLAESGAAQVIVMGRRSADDEATKVFSRMREAGAIVSVCRGDVTKKADVQAALAHAENISLRGVFHCAGVLDDGALLHQDWNRFERVLSPKLVGACNLHRLTANSPLDHFVLFSSVASVFGSPGQTNYAAANAFLDSMAQYRRAHGLPALSVNWGAWSETGAAVRHRVVERGSKIGIGGIPTRDGLRALEMLMTDTRPQVVVAPMDWKAYFAAAGTESNRPFLSGLRMSEMRSNDLRTARRSPPPVAPSQKNASWLPQLQAAAPARRQDLLMRLLEERVQVTLGLSQAQELDPAQPLQELGLDSLLSIELRNSLSACLNRSLPATLLFNYPTLNALAKFISRDVLANAAGSSHLLTAEREAELMPANLVDDIEALSDEEIDRMLSARAMGGAQ